MAGDPAERLARRLDRHGLRLVARVVIDAHRPLGPLLSDAAAFMAPMTGLVGRGVTADVGRLLATPDGLDRLVAALGRDGEHDDAAQQDGDGERHGAVEQEADRAEPG